MGFVWDFYGFPFFSHALGLPEAFQQRKAGTRPDCASSELVLYDIAVERPKVFGHKHVLRNMFGLDCASHRIKVRCWKKVRLRRRPALLAFGLCAEPSKECKCHFGILPDVLKTQKSTKMSMMCQSRRATDGHVVSCTLAHSSWLSRCIVEFWLTTPSRLPPPFELQS